MDLTLFPEPYRSELSAFPEPLLALLAGELQAGNELTEVGAGFPAPPVGGCAKLASNVTTHPAADAGTLRYREWPNWIYTSGFTDERGHFFILNPPPPPPPEPDMDAIRAAHTAPHVYAVTASAEAPNPQPEPVSEDLVQRFRSSMIIDYERWHDGIGYDLDALRQSTGEDRTAIEALLLNRGTADWRDIEALAALNTPQAGDMLRSVLDTNLHETRLAALRHAPHLFTERERTNILVAAIRESAPCAGFSQAMDQAAEAITPEIVDALLWAAAERPGEIAMHCAALADYALGKSSAPFDMSRRDFYIRFNTSNANERQNAFRDLCKGLALDPGPYMT